MKRLAVALLGWVLVIGAGTAAARQAKVLGPAALQDLLPASGPAGFTRQAPESRTQEVPGMGRVTEANVRFQTAGEVPHTLHVSIADLAEHSMRALVVQSKAHPGSRETGTGYEKAVTVLGQYPGSETVERMRQEYGVEFVVNDRFLVKVTGQWVEMPTVYEMAGKIPLDRLAKME